jgi:hypothetical protein
MSLLPRITARGKAEGGRGKGWALQCPVGREMTKLE